ncbi:MAG: hypothetical protein ACR2GH_20110 [Pseudonocardia sp.]
MLSPVEPAVFQLEDGRQVCWAGMFTGHRLLSEQELAQHAHRLLAVERSVLPTLTRHELIPHQVRSGVTPPALVLHSTTPTLRAFEGDTAELLAGRHPHDVATYTEARSVYLTRIDDLCVGRTEPWREAVGLRDVPAVDIGDTEYYYLSHALLAMAHEHENGRTTPLRKIIDWLRQRPDAVVRLYALDVETQIFLLWLRRQAGLEQISVEANAPMVTMRWNRKSHIHPTVSQVLELPTDGLDVEGILRAEQQHSEAYRRLRLTIPVLPGYSIPRTGVDPATFVAEVLRAAALLRSRYDIDVAALKPSEAGDGARIAGNLDLTDRELLTAAAQEAYPHGDDYLLEAWVDFLHVKVGGSIQPVVPSGHFRHGRVADGIALQALDRFSWRGNTYLDDTAWTGLGLPNAAYQAIRDALEAIHDAFLGPPSIADGSHRGLVVGGIDFAVGRIGGRFGDRTMVGAIDFNLSAHGAEYLRAFMDEAHALGTSERYAATHVFVPSARATLRELERVTASHAAPGGLVRAIACVPQRWAMVASTGTDPDDATSRVRAIVDAIAASDT